MKHLLIALLLISSSLFAQNVEIRTTGPHKIQYVKYGSGPLIYFEHGMMYNSLGNVMTQGPLQVKSVSAKPYYDSTNLLYPNSGYTIVQPYYNNSNSGTRYPDYFIDEVMDDVFPILKDTTNMFLVGYSLGGGDTDRYITRATQKYKFKAAVHVCPGYVFTGDAKNVKIPVAFYHSTSDTRVTLGSTTSPMYNSLKLLGKDVELFTFPALTHDKTDDYVFNTTSDINVYKYINKFIIKPNVEHPAEVFELGGKFYIRSGDVVKELK